MGRNSSGKTCLNLRFVDDTFSQFHQRTSPLAFKLRRLENVRGKAVNFQIFETEGSQSLATYANCAFSVRNYKAIIFCYDITDKQSLDDIPDMIKHNVFFSKNPEVQLYLLGTKSDLEEQRVVLTSDAIKFAEDNEITYLMEVSALQNIKVEEAFDRLAELILAQMGEIILLPSKSARTGTDGSTHEPPKNKLEKEEDLQANQNVSKHCAVC